MSSAANTIFAPAEGAVLDLASLDAIARAPSQLLRAWLASLDLKDPRDGLPALPGLVLEGLEPEGTFVALAPVKEGAAAAARLPGSPGSMVVTPGPDGLVHLTIRPGRALVSTAEGTLHLVEVPEPLRGPQPLSSDHLKSPILAVLDVNRPNAPAEGLPAGLPARATLGPRLRFVRLDKAPPHALPLALYTPDTGSWATDLRRLWPVGHPLVRNLSQALDDLLLHVWACRPGGDAFARAVLGQDWVRYQVTATAALVAAQQSLTTRPMGTLERVRLLEQLLRQLQGSVESAATRLSQVLGGAAAQGPYKLLTAPGVQA